MPEVRIVENYSQFPREVRRSQLFHSMAIINLNKHNHCVVSASTRHFRDDASNLRH